MDSRRLVRALAVGGLCFLFFGSAVGFVSAGSSPEETAESWTIPMPGPGDRATYDIEEEIVDRRAADRRLALPDVRFDVEWLPQADALAVDFTTRPAHPLATTFRYLHTDRETHAEVAFDAATGVPLNRAFEWTTPFQVEVDLVVLNQEAEGTTEGRRELFRGPLAPCGFRADLQGRAVHEGDLVQVFGGCEDEVTSMETTYVVRGWDDVDSERLLLLESVPSGLKLYYDPALPVPVRVEAHMLDQMYLPFAEGRLFHLELKAFHAGSQSFAPANPLAPPSTPQPVPLASLTPWTVDDSGITHPFPLAKAHAAAMDPANYADDAETVPDFMADHPDAYIAFAWGLVLEDSRGVAYHGWALLWTDGDDAIAKAIVQYPTAFYADLPVPGAPRWAYVQDWDTQMADDADELFPSRSALPGSLPSIAGLWPAAARFLEPRSVAPNSYSFAVVCADTACHDTQASVYAGYTKYPANEIDVALQDQHGQTALLGIDGDGLPLQAYLLDTRTQAPLPVLPASQAPPSATAPAAEGSVALAGWSLPAAEAVAGVGLLALLASAAYYFWPAVKGGAVGLFSRIEPDRVLDHPARKALFALVETNPGIHFQELVRRTGFGRGQLEHHLRKLEAAEFVSRVKGDSYACFFARGQVDRRVMAAAPLLRSDGGRSILAALQQRPGASSRQLAAQLGLAAGTVSYHVKRLREAGMLESAGGALRLTETGRQATALAAA